MNIQFLICSNCEKEKYDDEFIFLDNIKHKNIFKKEEIDLNYQSSSCNNNSTDNVLEIIEYPYSLNNNVTLLEDKPTINYPPKKEIKKYDDDSDDIKAPKLLSEGNKEEKNPNNANKKNVHIKMNSTNSESLINNDNSIMQNKALLLNYYKNSEIINNNKINNLIKKENKYDSPKKIINNETNNSKNIITNKIIGIKVDYPCPDTNSFSPLFSNEAINKKNEIKIKKQKKIEKKEKKFFLKKIKNKDKLRSECNDEKKSLEIKFKKQKSKANSNNTINIDKINVKSIKNETKNLKENYNKNLMINEKKNFTFYSFSNLGNIYNLRGNKSNYNKKNWLYKSECVYPKSNNFFIKSILYNKNNQKVGKDFRKLNKKASLNVTHSSNIINQSHVYSSKTYINPFIKHLNYKNKNIDI